MKGDGEAHPFLSPNDEFADYGTWDKGNLNLSELKTDDMLAGEYARSGLKRGLQLEEELGINPFKYGLVGATDSHTALSTAADDNYFGKTSGMEPNPDRMLHPFATFGGVSIMGWETLASGYQAIWAPENTREALFDAMERKETDLRNDRPTDAGALLWRPGLRERRRVHASAGGDRLSQRGADGRRPVGRAGRHVSILLVAALKDPIAPISTASRSSRVGWTATVSCRNASMTSPSRARTIGADGRATTPVGNTVDVANASWTNTIGDTELITVWVDPDFDPNEHAFYYVRVLEIPTPRWTAYDAKYYGIDNVPDDVEMVHQERAYTSPIWYTP